MIKNTTNVFKKIFLLLVLLSGCKKEKVVPESDSRDGVVGQYRLNGKFDYKWLCACPSREVMRRDTGNISYTLAIEKTPVKSDTVILKGMLYYLQGIAQLRELKGVVSGNELTIFEQHLYLNSASPITGKVTIRDDSVQVQYIITYRSTNCIHELQGKRR
jgi:hypothetical protein